MARWWIEERERRRKGDIRQKWEIRQILSACGGPWGKIGKAQGESLGFRCFAVRGLRRESKPG